MRVKRPVPKRLPSAAIFAATGQFHPNPPSPDAPSGSAMQVRSAKVLRDSGVGQGMCISWSNHREH